MSCGASGISGTAGGDCEASTAGGEGAGEFDGGASEVDGISDGGADGVTRELTATGAVGAERRLGLFCGTETDGAGGGLAELLEVETAGC